MKCLRYVRFEYEISPLTYKPNNITEDMGPTSHNTQVADYSIV